MRFGWSRFLDPHTHERLITDEGEFVIEEVRRHWVTRVLPIGEVILGMVFIVAMLWAGHYWWLPLAAGLAFGLNGFWRMHAEFMDRFMITNLRVFRVHGIVDQQMAIVPIVRVLDISMRRPFWGQVFGYAHFVFESAAQEQGLREIRFVGDPDRRQQIIQRVIIRSGVGGRADMAKELSSGT